MAEGLTLTDGVDLGVWRTEVDRLHAVIAERDATIGRLRDAIEPLGELADLDEVRRIDPPMPDEEIPIEITLTMGQINAIVYAIEAVPDEH